ncbi:MAG: NAD(+) diphosphatase [Candidatus Omnitrophica bacterium]|nr:NAD(+) diphosphatase [Candidatus Omnitrophota bacterium]
MKGFIKSAVKPENGEDSAYYICFLDDDVLVEKSNESEFFPLLTNEMAKKFGFQKECFIGFLNNKSCYTLATADKILSDEYQYISLRDIFLTREKFIFDITGYAKQIHNWNRNFSFCGRCASQTVLLPNEHARLCERCQLINYPRISPAIITVVVKDNQILLARGHKFQDKQMFSVLAGFVEAGESLEDCVKREILEEVGIEVKNVQYFKSQSWPFPDSLMIGFTAAYKSGEIKIDDNEIAEAGWFKADALPKIPNQRSLSGELIQWFLNNRKQHSNENIK